MEIRGLSDQRIIEFLSRSPVKSFHTILDLLSYLDGQWIEAELEYELFDFALGDNSTETVTLRLPEIPGTPSTTLFALTRHLLDYRFVRRRQRSCAQFDEQDAPTLIAFYSLTNTGRKLRHLLSHIEVGKQLLSLSPDLELDSASDDQRATGAREPGVLSISEVRAFLARELPPQCRLEDLELTYEPLTPGAAPNFALVVRVVQTAGVPLSDDWESRLLNLIRAHWGRDDLLLRIEVREEP